MGKPAADNERHVILFLGVCPLYFVILIGFKATHCNPHLITPHREPQVKVQSPNTQRTDLETNSAQPAQIVLLDIITSFLDTIHYSYIAQKTLNLHGEGISAIKTQTHHCVVIEIFFIKINLRGIVKQWPDPYTCNRGAFCYLINVCTQHAGHVRLLIYSTVQAPRTFDRLFTIP